MHESRPRGRTMEYSEYVRVRVYAYIRYKCIVHRCTRTSMIIHSTGVPVPKYRYTLNTCVQRMPDKCGRPYDDEVGNIERCQDRD